MLCGSSVAVVPEAFAGENDAKLWIGVRPIGGDAAEMHPLKAGTRTASGSHCSERERSKRSKNSSRV